MTVNQQNGKKNMTITRKGSSFKQTQIVPKDVDKNELNDMCYAVQRLYLVVDLYTNTYRSHSKIVFYYKVIYVFTGLQKQAINSYLFRC